jgi:Glycosyl transferase family 2
LPGLPSSNDFHEVREQIRALQQALDGEIAARKALQARLIQQDGHLRELERQTHALLQSRTWKALVWLGGLVVAFQERIAFWGMRSRLLRTNLKQFVLGRTEQAGMHLDFPKDDSIVSGRVKIHGWAAAESGVERIEIRIGNRLMLRPKTGIPRQDVAKAFPEFSDSAWSGFSAIADVSALPEGRYTLMLYATTRRGVLIGHHIHLQVKSVSRLVRRNTADESRALLQDLQRKPVISVLMPVYETPEEWLRRAIESIRTQFYPHWELCIADDCSPSPHVRRVLEEYVQQDPRVKVVYRDVNGHIPDASNSALELVTGEFVALVDHDDELTPDALLEVALAHNLNPDADMLYTDEDKLTKTIRAAIHSSNPTGHLNTC